MTNENKLTHTAREYALPLILIRIEREILASSRGSKWGRAWGNRKQPRATRAQIRELARSSWRGRSASYLGD